jgi:hypothetical protein
MQAEDEGDVPRGRTEEVHCIFHSSYAWYLFFNMLLNCLPYPIAGVRGRGRGRGRGTVLLSDIPSASGDVASQSAFSESGDEEMESRGFDVESRGDEEMVTAESGPSSTSTKKAKVRGETEVPKVEPAPEDRILISPASDE